MPIYTVCNTQSEETFDVNLKYEEFQMYLTENPHIKQVFNRFPGVVDPTRIGVRKSPDSFRDVLSKAKNAHRHSTIEF